MLGWATLVQGVTSNKLFPAWGFGLPHRRTSAYGVELFMQKIALP